MCAANPGHSLEKIIGKTHLKLEFGDLTKSRAQAVVNAANPSLLGGSGVVGARQPPGVDGAIHREGGPSILKECRVIVSQIGRLAPGRAVITRGGRLAAKYVIHTVGPIWRGGGKREAEILASAYRESLVLADKMALSSVAFPSISTGAYGYPLAAAAELALQTVKKYLEGESALESVIFMLFSSEAMAAYQAALEKL
jgi:O-acetyl-ADP-ribose deacetylase (regulator of RNase III)